MTWRQWMDAVLATLTPEQRDYIRDTKPADDMGLRPDVVDMIWTAAVEAGLVWWMKP